MLFYVRLLVPGARQETLQINLHPNENVQEIFRFVKAKQPQLKVKRILFAGQILKEDEPLSQYEIHKECTVQVMASKMTMEEMKEEEEASAGNMLVAPPPSFARQVTADEVRYGDALIINVLEARNLIPSDYWSGKSDPYVILELTDGHRKTSVRTAVVNKDLNPTWNETFGFVLQSPDQDLMQKQQLSVLVWDHDYLTPDDPLGTVDIDLTEIPRLVPGQPKPKDLQKEKDGGGEHADGHWYKLQGVDSGEVKLVLRRAALTSPMLRNVLEKLEKTRSRWTKRALEKAKVSLSHFLGEQPWVVGAAKSDGKTARAPLSADLHLNPALSHLEDLLRQGSFRLQNSRTVAKVANILWSQGAVHTQDLPTRYLWLCDVMVPDKHIFLLLQEVSGGSLKSLATWPSAPLAIGKAGHDDAPMKPRVNALATFKNAENAVLALLSLQNRVLEVKRKGSDSTREEFVVVDGKEDRPGKSPGLKRTPSEEAGLDVPVMSEPLHTAVQVRIYSEDDKGHVPVLLGFGSVADYSLETMTFDHPFANASQVGILSVAGPYATAANFEEKTADQGQTHQLSEWGKHLMILKPDGTLSAFIRVQDYPKPGPAFEMNICDKSCLVLSCGPWSLEVVDARNKVSYYMRAHNSDTLAQWKAIIRQVKKENRDKAKALAQRGSVVGGVGSDGEAAAAAKGDVEEKKELPAGSEEPVSEDNFQCRICNKHKQLSHFYVLDSQDGRSTQQACRVCLQKQIQETISSMSDDSNSKEAKPKGADRASTLLNTYSLQDLKDLGSAEQFQAFLDQCTKDFIASQPDKRYVHCPACDIAFEVEYHTWATKQPNLTKELGLDKQPLSADAQRHFLSNRFRCRNNTCMKDFCKLCHAIPYHTGFTCEEFKEYQVAPKCRFCSVGVYRRNKWRESPGQALENVCVNNDCIEKAKKSCIKLLGCGHPCGGCRDEEVCLPCLDDACVEKRKAEYKAAQEEYKRKKEEAAAVAVAAAAKAEAIKNGATSTVNADGIETIELPPIGTDLEAEAKKEHETAVAAADAAAKAVASIPEVDRKLAGASKTSKDDLCGICYCDELGNAPSIQLECGHIFHHSCVLDRLEKKWDGLRVSFKYCRCPYCNDWMAAKHIEKVMEPHNVLFKRVERKIEDRLELDEDEDEDFIKRVNDPASDFFNDPMAWGWKSYAYYMCNVCKSPYFGGKRNCEDNAADEKNNADEMVCYDCASVVTANKCDKPGHSEYIMWKCRFCCSPSVWFCFGTTHFCDYCHSHWPPNRHPPNEKCPGPDGKCPLGLPVGSHKNGAGQDCEHGLGCGMCRNTMRTEKAEQMQKELEELRARKLEKKKARWKAAGLDVEAEEKKYLDRRKEREAEDRALAGKAAKAQEEEKAAPAAQVNVLRCTKGHECKKTANVYGSGRFICNRCRGHKRQEAYHCAQCQYDVCLVCAQKVLVGEMYFENDAQARIDFRFDAAKNADPTRPVHAELFTNSNSWRALRSKQVYNAGKWEMKIKIIKSPVTSNTWKWTIGVVPPNFNLGQAGSRCVGGAGRGWSWVGETGKIYNGREQDWKRIKYGEGDEITTCLDFDAKTIGFKKNGEDLGVAFRNLVGPVHFGLSMVARGAQFEIVVPPMQIAEEVDVKSDDSSDSESTDDSIEIAMKMNVNRKVKKRRPHRAQPNAEVRARVARINNRNRGPNGRKNEDELFKDIRQLMDNSDQSGSDTLSEVTGDSSESESSDVSVKAEALEPEENDPNAQWNCVACTFLNAPELNACEICETAKPKVDFKVAVAAPVPKPKRNAQERQERRRQRKEEKRLERARRAVQRVAQQLDKNGIPAAPPLPNAVNGPPALLRQPSAGGIPPAPALADIAVRAIQASDLAKQDNVRRIAIKKREDQGQVKVVALNDLLKDIRRARYGRANNDVMVPFGRPDSEAEEDYKAPVAIDNNGIPRAPPLPGALAIPPPVYVDPAVEAAGMPPPPYQVPQFDEHGNLM